VAQFYATTWRSGEGLDSTLNFIIEGHIFELKISELPTIFAFARIDFDRELIITERYISDNELAPLYYCICILIDIYLSMYNYHLDMCSSMYMCSYDIYLLLMDDA
jgi:hypothetical protein